GGPFREIASKVPGIRISEHLPKLALQMDHIALIRSMTSKEGEHGLATFYGHTGYAARGPIRYPTRGALAAKELGDEHASLTDFVSIAPLRAINPAAHAPGFLGPRYAPLVVGVTGQAPNQRAGTDYAKSLQVEDLEPPAGLGAQHVAARLRMVE